MGLLRGVAAKLTLQQQQAAAVRGLGRPAGLALRLGGAKRGFAGHEIWRAEADNDSLPKVKRRDGTFAEIDKQRG
jgi:hypothetical protein